MKKVVLLALLVLSAGCATTVTASQKKPKNPAPAAAAAEEEDNTVITEDCKTNMSLAHESVKHNQFDEDVWNQWMAVYKDCPSFSNNIYRDGEKLIEWRISEAQKANNTADVTKYKDMLMKLYDKRMKYFGSDAKYPLIYLKGKKALAYIKYFPEDETMAGCYPWLKEVADTLAAWPIDAPSLVAWKDNEPEFLRQFEIASYKMYKADNSRAETYLEDHLLIGTILDDLMADSTYKYADLSGDVKNNLDQLFATSGAADCDQLDKIYGPQVAGHANDLDWLNNMMRLYGRVDCKESEVYFDAAEAAFKMQPTAAAAAGLAAKAIKDKNNSEAISYLSKAVDLADKPADKGKYEKLLAYLYSQQGSYGAAREHARKAYGYNAALAGEMHRWIASWYAKSGISGWYWAAYDESGDPSYRRHFPDKTEMFMNPNIPKEGTRVTVGGWIGVSTIARGR